MLYTIIKINFKFSGGAGHYIAFFTGGKSSKAAFVGTIALPALAFSGYTFLATGGHLAATLITMGMGAFGAAGPVLTPIVPYFKCKNTIEQSAVFSSFFSALSASFFVCASDLNIDKNNTALHLAGLLACFLMAGPLGGYIASLVAIHNYPPT